MTHKEEKIKEFEEEFRTFNRDVLFCHFDDMGGIRARKTIFFFKNFLSQTIDSLEAKHQEEIKQLLEGIKGKIEKKLMLGFDKLESEDLDGSMEQWKNYKFIRNNIRDIIKTI